MRVGGEGESVFLFLKQNNKNLIDEYNSWNVWFDIERKMNIYWMCKKAIQMDQWHFSLYFYFNFFFFFFFLHKYKYHNEA